MVLKERMGRASVPQELNYVVLPMLWCVCVCVCVCVCWGDGSVGKSNDCSSEGSQPSVQLQCAHIHIINL